MYIYIYIYIISFPGQEATLASETWGGRSRTLNFACQTDLSEKGRLSRRVRFHACLRLLTTKIIHNIQCLRFELRRTLPHRLKWVPSLMGT